MENGLSLIFQVEFYVSHCNTLLSRAFDIVRMADILLLFNLSISQSLHFPIFLFSQTL